MKFRRNSFFKHEEENIVIEVEQKPGKRRVILLIVCALVAVAALGIWLYDAVKVEPGLYTVTAQTSQPHSGDEMLFLYYAGSDGRDAKKDKNAATEAYTQACLESYALFAWEAESTEGGVRYVSDHPNQAVSVDSRLYKALAQAADSRLLYMGPVTAEYSAVFTAGEEYLASQIDPAKNPEARAYITELMGFIGSEEHIRLELLGNDQVKLCVSEAYLTFAKENGVKQLLDFGWMRNAFVADFVADALTEQGFVNGYLETVDGYGCYLGGQYTVVIRDRIEQDVYLPALYTVEGGTRTVTFRNYPLSGEGTESLRYFGYRDGSISTIYTDPSDGVSKSATDNLFCYSKTASCAQMVLRCAPLYLTEELDESALIALGPEGIYTVWAEGKELRYTDGGLKLTMTEDSGYTQKHVTQ